MSAALGRSSGMPVTIEHVQVVEVRDGIVIRHDFFWNLEEARRVAGMAP